MSVGTITNTSIIVLIMMVGVKGITKDKQSVYWYLGTNDIKSFVPFFMVVIESVSID